MRKIFILKKIGSFMVGINKAGRLKIPLCRAVLADEKF